MGFFSMASNPRRATSSAGKTGSSGRIFRSLRRCARFATASVTKPAFDRTDFNRRSSCAGFFAYRSAASGNTQESFSRFVVMESKTLLSGGRIGISTRSPVFPVFTVTKPDFRSTLDHFSIAQSPRRIAVQIAVTASFRIRASLSAASSTMDRSSAVNGCLWTVSSTLCGVRCRKVRYASAPGSNTRNTPFNRLSRRFHVRALIPNDSCSLRNIRTWVDWTDAKSATSR